MHGIHIRKAAGDSPLWHIQAKADGQAYRESWDATVHMWPGAHSVSSGGSQQGGHWVQVRSVRSPRHSMLWGAADAKHH